MSEVTTNEYNEDGKLIRKIRSFVRREGRLTKGQENAMKECWPTMGIDYQKQLLDWKEVFGNDNPVVLEIGFGMGASLVEMAKNAPEKNFFGIEVHSPGVGACLSDARDAGITNLRVDWENYAEHMIEIMNQAPGYSNIAQEGDYIPRPEERPLTKFEARGHRLGHGVWDIKFKRVS